jgi:hypothetical protein
MSGQYGRQTLFGRRFSYASGYGDEGRSEKK